MWNCEKCGCKNIAGPLDVCPMCFKEATMPKITSAGSSNQWEEPEVTEIPVMPVEAAVEAPTDQEPEQVQEAAETVPGPVAEQPQDQAPQQPTVEELQAQIAQLQNPAS